MSFAAKAMKLAPPFDELLDRIEELEIGRTGLGELLPIASRAGQMSQAFLLRARRVRDVTRIAIRHERAGKVIPENVT